MIAAGAVLGILIYFGALAFAGRFNIGRLFVAIAATGMALWIFG